MPCSYEGLSLQVLNMPSLMKKGTVRMLREGKIVALRLYELDHSQNDNANIWLCVRSAIEVGLQSPARRR